MRRALVIAIVLGLPALTDARSLPVDEQLVDGMTVSFISSLASAMYAADAHVTGVPPLKDGSCPAEHPIKGNFTTYSGERCIFHRPGHRFYAKTRAERCYANELEAVRDGCRKSKV